MGTSENKVIADIVTTKVSEVSLLSNIKRNLKKLDILKTQDMD